ncbi:hypothetical protein LB504_003016 [Fusarium proliferatum]|nr:hypothetical protein LB504_003016 [Fusarium proliferatum]
MATLHASEPITIFTWHTIFNLRLAQRCKSFICADLTTGLPLQLESTKGPKRPQFTYELGDRDDDYSITLEPEILLSSLIGSFDLLALKATEFLSPAIVRDNEEVEWWRYGRKEDVMSPSGQSSSKKGCEDPSGPPIRLSHIDPVEFQVE